jgi:hypothetical protein
MKADVELDCAQEEDSAHGQGGHRPKADGHAVERDQADELHGRMLADPAPYVFANGSSLVQIAEHIDRHSFFTGRLDLFENPLEILDRDITDL